MKVLSLELVLVDYLDEKEELMMKLYQVPVQGGGGVEHISEFVRWWTVW